MSSFSLYEVNVSNAKTHIEIKHKMKTILETYTDYKELYSIGDEDSYVYTDRTRKLVIKCIREVTFKYGSEDFTSFMKDNRSYRPITKDAEEDTEITLLKYAFNNPKQNWFEVKDLFYIVMKRQEEKETYLTPWLCAVFVHYPHTFRLFPYVLSDREKICICHGLVSGLHDLHRLGYSHGDLKPPNICLDETLETKLIDFGTAMSFSHPRYLYSWKNSFAYFTPRQCYNHLQYRSRTFEYYKVDVLMFRRQFESALQTYNIGFIQDDYKLCEEHGICNDLFVVGLLIGEWFTERIHFFYGKSVHEKMFDPANTEFLTTILSSVLKFIRDPTQYIEDYYCLTSFPESIKPIFEFCLSGWNNTTRQIDSSYTSQLMMLLSNIDLKE